MRKKEIPISFLSLVLSVAFFHSSYSNASDFFSCFRGIFGKKIATIGNDDSAAVHRERVAFRAKQKRVELQKNTPCKFKISTGGLMEEIEVFDARGAQLGFIDFTINSGTMKIQYIESFSINRGVATMLLARALEEFPAVTRIQGSLSETNQNEFMKARKRGLTPVDAIKETPAYKMRRSLGFSKIDVELTNLDTPTLITEWQP